METPQRRDVFSDLLGCFAVPKLEEAHLLHASTVVPLGRGTGRGGYDGNDDGGGGGSLYFSSILLLRLESSFVSSDKFGVGNPSVRAG